MPAQPAHYSAAETACYERNHARLVAQLLGKRHPDAHTSTTALGLELERFVIDEARGTTVSYEGHAGEPGVRDLLEGMQRYYGADARVMIDGHLAGYTGELALADGTVGISISLEPAAQLEASVGPSSSPELLFEALEAFDRQVAEITRELGVSWRLVALGYNPTIDAPTDLTRIPKKRYRAMEDYLSRTGRYALDMMRGSASAQVSVDYDREADAIAAYRVASCLAPVLSFACDNAPVWRDLKHGRAPRMVRGRIWEHMDRARCGLVPHVFDPDFSLEDYANFVEAQRTICFTDRDGTTVATGNTTSFELMHERDMDSSEIAHLLSMVFVDVRLKGFMEIRVPDSLEPPLAAALAAFVKGLFASEESFCAVRELFADATAGEVQRAWATLEAFGWEATLFGHTAPELIDTLVAISKTGLTPAEQELAAPLWDLWARRLVPRDAISEI